MSAKKKKNDLRSIEDELYALAHKSAEVLQLTSEGFNLHSRKHLDEAEKLAKEIHASHIESTSALLDFLENNKGELGHIKKLIPIPGHLERIGDACESIISVTRTKINKGTLFSDRAVAEINYIFKNSIDLIKSAGDIVLTKNALLTKHIVAEAGELIDKAEDCATMHEERLVSGICNLRSGSMFLDILDSLKGIMFHLKKIAQTTL